MAAGAVSDDLRDVIDFVEGFLAAEHAARQAMHREPDDAKYGKAEKNAASYLHSEKGSPVVLGFGRPAGEAGKAMLDEAAADAMEPRALYLVARHRDGERVVYRAFVGSPRDRRARRYALVLNIAHVEGDLKIVGETAVNPFGSDRELEWEPAGGDQLETVGPPEESAKLQRPQDPVHAAHFDAY